MQHKIILLIKILLNFTLIFSNFTTIESKYGPPNLSSWCKQTPNSNQCEYHLSQNKFPTPLIKTKLDFLNMMIQNTILNANQSLKIAYSQFQNCENEIEKAVLTDCLELYDLAIDHLNQTMYKTNSSQIDSQTWLSTSLTLFQTCQNEFSQLNISNNNNLIPILNNNVNVSSLISNVLAINNDELSINNPTSFDTVDRFPDWVRPGDRRLLESGSSGDIVVAQDGSGEYRSIGEAIKGASSKGGDRIVIYIKSGTYRENVNIGLKDIMLLGDGIGKTIITGSRSVGGGYSTFQSATVAATGSGFMAQGITFRNTAGPSNHQAVAFRSNSDFSVFYKCSFEGYQDTLYVFTNRQFYRECDMYGTVDFLFGNAAAVLQNCNILTRHPPAGTNTLTAQGRTDPNQNTGIVIHNCRVGAAESQNGARTYLGRPWQRYSRTVFMKTYLDGDVSPRGWLEWSGNFALSTLYYGEYMNTGPGSSTGSRVSWPGHHVMSTSEAEKFTSGNFINGNSWLPKTGVPFTGGL